MTVAEAKRFYANDLKEYDLLKNKQFLKWYKKVIKSGYHVICDIDSIQSLINFIFNWYEEKYPEYVFKDNNEQIITEYANLMSMNTLLYYLSDEQFSLLKCERNSETYNHSIDLELRKKIIDLTILKLLYSKTTIPERGEFRAKKFVLEFEKKFGLNNSITAIDDVKLKQ